MGQAGLPIVYLVRHGGTAWTVSGQYTGVTDLPLTPRGERAAGRLGEHLHEIHFAKVYTSPLRRASRTCELAGYGAVAQKEPDLRELDYGEFEGQRSADIRAAHPDWQLFRHGCPGGESPAQVCARADHVVQRVRDVADNVLLFSSGHFMRAFAVRWLGLEPSVHCQFLVLGTASLSALGYDHSLSQPVIRLWNQSFKVAE
jgi:probable phosphoglycerate mutase